MTTWRFTVRLLLYALFVAYLTTFKHVFQSSLQDDQLRQQQERQQQQDQSPVPPKQVILPHQPEDKQNDHNLSKTSPQNTTKVKPETRKGSVGNATFPKRFVPKIYRAGPWDLAPIVVEEYRLLFFTQGKVACTEFKKLFRRMMHLEDWHVHKEPQIPHDPRYNGLRYLYDYPLKQALHMLTDSHWMRAIFVRDPKERFLSAYLDKAAKKNGRYLDRHCCLKDADKDDSCGKRASKSLLDFIQIVQTQCCCDPHWKPQSRRIDNELWDYVNFVGYFHDLAGDTQRMLQRVGNKAWEEFGASGWGTFQNESIFMQSSTAKHRTSARTKMLQYFNDSITEDHVETFYSGDYHRFQFDRYRLVISDS